ncbi:MAG: HEAT repeat domain-containing protein [Phycisphaerae bacterium]|nr:HEAT repeat domain-containing protein [Phycisphaerae bacterium]
MDAKAGRNVRNFCIFCLGLLVAAGMLQNVSCAPEVAAPELTADQQLEFDTLKAQLLDVKRASRTRFEAARLLLGKPYPQAVQTLRQQLADPSNPSAQIAIAEAIALDGGDRKVFIKPLFGMLTGDEPLVRPLAADALVTYHDHGVIARLIAIARNRGKDRAVRLVVIKAFQRVVSKRCIGALVDLLGDPDPTIRTGAAESLQKLTGMYAFGASRAQWRQWWKKNRNKDRLAWLESMTDGLARAKMSLEKSNAQLRQRLVKAKEELYNASAKTHRPGIVLAMLNDPVEDIRLLGATLTNKMIESNETITPELRQRVRMMLDDGDPRIRNVAAMLEASLADRRTVRLLLRRLRSETQPAVRVGLFGAIGQVKDPKALPAVIMGIRSQENSEATAAAKAMGRIAAEKPLTAVQQAIAAEALVQRYTQAGKKNSEELREALLEAMAVVADKRAAASLIDALTDKAGVIRLAAVTGLGRLEVKDAAAAIEPLIADTDRGVRQAAIAALVKLGGNGYLRKILARTDPATESDPEVRRAAADGVRTLCKTADAKTLAELLEVLNKRKDAIELKIDILKQYVAVRRANKQADLTDDLRKLGLALYEAGRAEEAAPPLAEAYALAKEHPKPKSSVAQRLLQGIWFDYVGILLAANDPSFAGIMAQRPDADEFNSFRNGVKLLRKRLAELSKKKEYLAVVSLSEAALGQLAKRLTARQQADLQTILARAHDRQLALDRRQIEALLPGLLSVELDRRAEAETQIKNMGDRAVHPLLEQLKTAASADTPDPKAEDAIFDVLRQINPKLGEYDSAAEKAQRLARIDAWLKKS